MPKTKISEFSSTPANNTDIDSINLAEGCAPSGINDAIRELMSQLKDWQSGTSNDPYVVGSSGSLTLNQGTANTVPYLNGSKVVTSGTALSFDGTNLGLGVTPSAWSTPAFNFGSSAVGSLSVIGTTTSLGNNINYNSGYKYTTSAAAGLYQISNNVHYWFNAPSGTAGNAITFTQAMTLDASGNLGVGGSSPSTAGTGKIFALQASGSTASQIKLQNGNTGSTSQDGLLIGLDASTSAGYLYNYENAPLIFGTNDAERARIDSSGNLLVGQTTNPAPGRVAISFASGSFGTAANYTTGTGTCYFYAFNYNGGGVGNISSNGTTTTYATSSDYRLKNITGALTGYKERLMSLLPKQGTWIIDGSEFRGFLAHDFANPYPKSVTGEKDAVDADGKPVMQSMQASSSEVMADLVAMVKDLIAENASLKARLDAANL